MRDRRRTRLSGKPLDGWSNIEDTTNRNETDLHDPRRRVLGRDGDRALVPPSAQIWIPSRDTGVDLLVTDRQQAKVASLQTKFSKDYLGSAGSAPSAAVVSTGWWTFQRKKVAASSADYWVLVLYRFQSREFDFVVVPPHELLARYDKIAPKQAAIQSYFTVTAKKRCWETRGLDKASKSAVEAGTYANPEREFTHYLNAWPFKKPR